MDQAAPNGFPELLMVFSYIAEPVFLFRKAAS